MAVNKNFVVKNGLEVKSNLLVAESSLDSVGIGTSYIKEKLHVIGGIGATTLFVGGIGTVHVASGTTARYDNATLSGVATASGLNVLGITSTKDLNVVGVLTAGTYYGDGSTLTGVSVGVRTAGAVLGYGVTFLDFRGTGVSTAYFNSNVGIGTIFFQGGGGSGTVSISSAAPSSPTNGDLWYSIDYGRTFVYYDEVELGVGSTAVWVDAAPFNAGGKYIGAYGGTSYGSIGNTAGTKTVPSWNFTDDTNTGIFQGGTADHLSFSAGGSGIATVNVGGLAVSGVVTSHSLSLSGDATVAGNLNVTGDLVYDEERGANILISGVGTATGLNVLGITSTKNLNVTGVSTFKNDLRLTDSIVHLDDTNTKIRFPSADTITAETAGTERVRVTGLGTVGIGTVDPELKLHIQDSVLPSRSLANSNCDVVIEGETNTGIQFFSGTQTQLRFGDAGSTASGAIIYQHKSAGSSIDNFKINFSNSGYLTFNDGGGENLRFTPNNEIGVAGANYGDAGQVLTSGGSGAAISWSSIAAGGSGEFNTSISGATQYDVTTSMAAAYTANASSDHRTIVHSIHICNISASEASISGEIQASFSIAHNIPVPAGSAVELLKQPKVLGPSETIELQSDTASALEATIIVEYKEDTDFWDAQIDLTSAATMTDIYTSTSNPSVVQSILLANDDGTNDVKARVAWTDGSNNIQSYLCYDMVIPAESTVELCEKPKYLASGYKLRGYANQADRLEITASGKQITS